MAKVTIYGHSDDCIEVEGDVREEFDAYEGYRWLHFNDGTIVNIGYDQMPDKGWDISVVKLGAGTKANVLEPEMQDGDHYTDRLELVGKIKSVKCRRNGGGTLTDGELEDFFENFSWRDYTVKQLVAAYAILEPDR